MASKQTDQQNETKTKGNSQGERTLFGQEHFLVMRPLLLGSARQPVPWGQANSFPTGDCAPLPLISLKTRDKTQTKSYAISGLCVMSLRMGCKMEIRTFEVIAFCLNQFRFWLQLDNPALNCCLMYPWVVKQQVPFISQEMAFNCTKQSL